MRGGRPMSPAASSAASRAFSWFRSHRAISSTLLKDEEASFASPRRCRRPMPPQPTRARGRRSDMQASAIGQGARCDVEQRFVPREKAFQLVDHEAEETRPTGCCYAGDMRTEKDIRHVAHGAIQGKGLRIEHVEADANIACTGARDERFRIDDCTARDVDEYRVSRQQGQLRS